MDLEAYAWESSFSGSGSGVVTSKLQPSVHPIWNTEPDAVLAAVSPPPAVVQRHVDDGGGVCGGALRNGAKLG
jgi:hypothetical protein